MPARYRALGALALVLLPLLAGCEAFRSDAENYARRERAERAERLKGMRLATMQAPAGEAVSGDAIGKLLSGRTHVFVYEIKPGGQPGRYVEYSHFGADGRYIYMNTEWMKDSAGRDGDRWRVDGDRVCILNQSFSSTEQCYRLSVLPDGSIQYFISRPGDEADGLMTKVTSSIESSLPELE